MCVYNHEIERTLRDIRRTRRRLFKSNLHVGDTSVGVCDLVFGDSIEIGGFIFVGNLVHSSVIDSSNDCVSNFDYVHNSDSTSFIFYHIVSFATNMANQDRNLKAFNFNQNRNLVRLCMQINREWRIDLMS